MAGLWMDSPDDTAVTTLFHLTRLPLDKMGDILADAIFKCIFVNEKSDIFIWISLKFVP